MTSNRKKNKAVSNYGSGDGEYEEPGLFDMLGSLDELGELGDDMQPLAEIVREAQEEEAAKQARRGKKVDAKKIVVRVNGQRYCRSEKGELLAAVPCATCWDEVWEVVDSNLPAVEFYLLQGLWEQEEEGSYCSYCASLAGENLSRNEVYARRCYEYGCLVGRLALQQGHEEVALVRQFAGRMGRAVNKLWEDELERRVRLQRATPAERREAQEIFLREVARGLRETVQ